MLACDVGYTGGGGAVYQVQLLSFVSGKNLATVVKVIVTSK